MSLPTIAGVQSRIHNLPGHPPIMLADAIAEVFGTTAKRLMEQVRRNMDLFPTDFLIELSDEEYRRKLPQIAATSQGKRTDLTHYGFTEAGALMVPAVLRTPEARAAAPVVVRAFVTLRETLVAAMQRELAVDRATYIKARAIRAYIDMAAREGWSYLELYGRFTWSHRVLVAEIEAMRARGIIALMALTPPLYILGEIEAKRAFIAAHVEDTRQMRLGLEG